MVIVFISDAVNAWETLFISDRSASKKGWVLEEDHISKRKKKTVYLGTPPKQG